MEHRRPWRKVMLLYVLLCGRLLLGDGRCPEGTMGLITRAIDVKIWSPGYCKKINFNISSVR